ncbi:MAG: YbaB/EbfC family nucleoid-associated protein [Proteobacteria bacterium]|nr:YbaB/EbfC family nucleoid-associated protein [Pseudomonadota bacterium]
MSKGLAGMMKQAQKMQTQMAKLQEEAAKKTVEASSGGGMITAVVNGKQQLLSLKIEEAVVDPSDIEMLQDLIVAAINEAMKQSQDMVASEMNKLTGGMKIPGLF